MARNLTRLLRARLGTGVALILLVFSAVTWAQIAVPALTQRVTDLTATLSPDQVAALESRLAAFERQKGSQIAILLVPSTAPEDIAQFGIRVAESWKIGREKIDDGVILIVAKNDRVMRIEVGYGLEGVIPDAIAKRIISETITPYFKAGDFYGGIDAGITQIMQLIQGEPLPPPRATDRARDDSGVGSFLPLLIGGVIVGFVLSAFLGRPLAGGVAAAGTGLVAWLVLGLGAMALLTAVLVFFGVAAGFGRGGGVWTGGGFGGGLGGGGLGRGGGFGGGGGGGFGGGGASGSW